MREWLKRGLAMVALAGVLVASNLHLPLIQGIAWVRMYEHYRVGYSPALALEVTFSGKAPCNLCKFVQLAQKEQKKLDSLIVLSGKVLLPVSIIKLQLTPQLECQSLMAEPAMQLAKRDLPPELPPPRWA